MGNARLTFDDGNTVVIEFEGCSKLKLDVDD